MSKDEKKNAPAAPAAEGAGSTDGSKGETKAKKAEQFYYIVKTECYVDDERTIGQGVYLFDKPHARLDRMKNANVEKYVGVPPITVLQRVAKSLKINVERVVDNKIESLTAEEILARVVKTL